MQHKITQLGLDDYEECLDFLKKSFNEYEHTVDFDRELPKAFRPKQELMEQHYAIRDDKRILALLGIYPMELYVGGETVRCATVGNVATHPEERGKGYMQTLFTEAMHEVDRRNIDMTRLGGLRQRYNRYGYEYAGMSTYYTFSTRNAKAYLAENAHRKLSFVPMDVSRGELVKAAFALYQSSECHVDRIDEETFLCVLRAHYMEPLAAVDENGAFAGYVTASANHELINEQYTAPSVSGADLDIAWLEQHGLSEVKVYLKCWDMQNRTLGRYAEYSTFVYPSMFRVKNWENVVRPFLQYKANHTGLADGRVMLSIENDGTYAIEVNHGHAACSRTEEASDVVADHLTATRLLFGVLPPELTIDTNREALVKLSSWLPLPLSWSGQDNV